jgi:PHP family Zn ribbon phosphoesterase
VTTTIQLTMKRPERPNGIETIEVTFNGHIETVEDGEGGQYGEFLFEADDREARLRALREKLT